MKSTELLAGGADEQQNARPVSGTAVYRAKNDQKSNEPHCGDSDENERPMVVLLGFGEQLEQTVADHGPVICDATSQRAIADGRRPLKLQFLTSGAWMRLSTKTKLNGAVELGQRGAGPEFNERSGSPAGSTEDPVRDRLRVALGLGVDLPTEGEHKGIRCGHGQGCDEARRRRHGKKGKLGVYCSVGTGEKRGAVGVVA